MHNYGLQHYLQRQGYYLEFLHWHDVAFVSYGVKRCAQCLSDTRRKSRSHPAILAATTAHPALVHRSTSSNTTCGESPSAATSTTFVAKIMFPRPQSIDLPIDGACLSSRCHNGCCINWNGFVRDNALFQFLSSPRVWLRSYSLHGNVLSGLFCGCVSYTAAGL